MHLVEGGGSVGLDRISESVILIKHMIEFSNKKNESRHVKVFQLILYAYLF
jgi:hypothetical protein